LHEVVIDSNALSANVGYCIFTPANEKFTNAFVKASTKSDATMLHFCKPSYRVQMENCHATVSLMLCCLRGRSKSFWFRAVI